MRVAKLVSKIIQSYLAETQQDQKDNASDSDDQLDLSSMLKQYKSNIKFVQKEISEPRIKVSSLIEKASGADAKSESSIQHLVQLRKLVSLENLILNLCLVSLVPQGAQDQKLVVETLEDIEEVKACYQDLGLIMVSENSNKKRKESADKKEAQLEAESNLMDFLISMLTKPQSFLREVANTCFQHFSTSCIDGNSLERLLAIVATPNKEAGVFMDGEQAEGEESDQEIGDLEEIGGEDFSEESD